jgi:hypothetical protein
VNVSVFLIVAVLVFVAQVTIVEMPVLVRPVPVGPAEAPYEIHESERDQ